MSFPTWLRSVLGAMASDKSVRGGGHAAVPARAGTALAAAAGDVWKIRLAPAVALGYAGPGSVLNRPDGLRERFATPTITISETSANMLTINLGRQHLFATGRRPASAAGLPSYQERAARPGTSHVGHHQHQHRKQLSARCGPPSPATCSIWATSPIRSEAWKTSSAKRREHQRDGGGRCRKRHGRQFRQRDLAGGRQPDRGRQRGGERAARGRSPLAADVNADGTGKRRHAEHRWRFRRKRWWNRRTRRRATPSPLRVPT